MKTLLTTLVMVSHLALAVDTETLVRVAWAQAVAERESLPELPDNADDDRGGLGTGTSIDVPSAGETQGAVISQADAADIEELNQSTEGGSHPAPIRTQEGIDVGTLSDALNEALLIAAESEELVSSDPLARRRIELLQTPDEETGEDPDSTQIVMFGFEDCVPCLAAKPWLDALQESDWTARYMDVHDHDGSIEAFNITVCPTFVVFQDYEEAYRLEAPLDLDADWISLCEVLDELNADEEVSQAVQGAFLNMGDLVNPLLGRTFELSEDARIIIPSGMRFRTEPTSDGLRIVFTSGKPTAEVDKLVTWQVTIDGLGFSREELTLILNGVPDVSVSFDWAN